MTINYQRFLSRLVNSWTILNQGHVLLIFKTQLTIGRGEGMIAIFS